MATARTYWVKYLKHLAARIDPDQNIPRHMGGGVLLGDARALRDLAAYLENLGDMSYATQTDLHVRVSELERETPKGAIDGFNQRLHSLELWREKASREQMDKNWSEWHAVDPKGAEEWLSEQWNG